MPGAEISGETRLPAERPGIAGFEYYGSDGKWIAGKYLHLGVPGEE